MLYKNNGQDSDLVISGPDPIFFTESQIHKVGSVSDLRFGSPTLIILGVQKVLSFFYRELKMDKSSGTRRMYRVTPDCWPDYPREKFGSTTQPPTTNRYAKTVIFLVIQPLRTTLIVLFLFLFF